MYYNLQREHTSSFFLCAHLSVCERMIPFQNWNQNIYSPQLLHLTQNFSPVITFQRVFPQSIASKLFLTSKSWYNLSFCLLLFMDSTFSSCPLPLHQWNPKWVRNQKYVKDKLMFCIMASFYLQKLKYLKVSASNRSWQKLTISDGEQLWMLEQTIQKDGTSWTETFCIGKLAILLERKWCNFNNRATGTAWLSSLWRPVGFCDHVDSSREQLHLDSFFD